MIAGRNGGNFPELTRDDRAISARLLATRDLSLVLGQNSPQRFTGTLRLVSSPAVLFHDSFTFLQQQLICIFPRAALPSRGDVDGHDVINDDSPSETWPMT